MSEFDLSDITTRTWPIWGDTHIDEPLLLLISHLSQTVVSSGQVTLKAGERRDDHALYLAALGAGARRGQAQATDAAACAHTGGENVAFVEHPRVDLGNREDK